jgi:hypothetical protein
MHHSLHAAIAAERHRDLIAAAENARGAGPHQPLRPVKALAAIASRRRSARLRPHAEPSYCA